MGEINSVSCNKFVTVRVVSGLLLLSIGKMDSCIYC